MWFRHPKSAWRNDAAFESDTIQLAEGRTWRKRSALSGLFITGLKESEVRVTVISENAYFKMEVIYAIL